MCRCARVCPYDPLTSFLPVHLVGESPNLFVAYHDAPYNSVPEFIAYAKQNPGKVTFSSSGVGTATHLVAELFKTVAGIEMLHVPYKGSAPALNDLIAGRVDVMFDYPVSVGPHVDAGKLKVLATTAPERLRNVPNAPTMAELGLKDMTTQSWSSIMVPAGTPAPVVDRLAAAAHAALTSERVRTHFEKFGTRPMMQQKAEMIPFIEKEIVRWGDVIACGAGEAVARCRPPWPLTKQGAGGALCRLVRHARPCAGHPRLPSGASRGWPGQALP